MYTWFSVISYENHRNKCCRCLALLDLYLDVILPFLWYYVHKLSHNTSSFFMWRYQTIRCYLECCITVHFLWTLSSVRHVKKIYFEFWSVELRDNKTKLFNNYNPFWRLYYWLSPVFTSILHVNSTYVKINIQIYIYIFVIFIHIRIQSLRLNCPKLLVFIIKLKVIYEKL